MDLGAEARRTAAYGAAIGLVGALVSWTVDIAVRGLGFSLEGIAASHATNPLVWLADVAPLTLAGLGAYVGRAADDANATRKRAREAERKAAGRRRYRTAFENLSDGVLIEYRGAIREANPAAGRILGLPAEALAEQPVERFLPDIRKPEAGVQVVRASAAGEVLGVAWRHIGADAEGRSLHLEVTSALLTPDELVMHVIRDVSEEVAAVQRARQIQRSLVDQRDRAEATVAAQQQFLAASAHQLRTPLASMLGYLDLLEEEAEERGLEQAFADLRRVRSATGQVFELVEKIHDQAMIEAGKLSLFLAPIELRELLDEVREVVRPLLGVDVALAFELPSELPDVRADRRRLRQILLTLLSNAAQFTARGAVTVRATQLGEGRKAEIALSIADTGAGIGPDLLATLFEPFEGRRPGRSGLGMAICHELARLLGGQLTVDSEVGRGTTFTLTLPVAHDELKVERLVSTRSKVGGGRVLLLVDDPHVRGTLEARLGARGIQVLSATSSLSAAESATALLPSAVIADLGLVRADPWSELALLTAAGPLARVPVHGVALRGGKGLWLPLGGVLPTPPDRKRLQERAAAVGDPERAVVLVGGGRGAARPLQDVGWTVVEPDASEGAFADAGLLVVDLLADEAAGLGAALAHTGRVPLLGLLPPAPTDTDRAAARRVLTEHVEARGIPEEELLERILGAIDPG